MIDRPRHYNKEPQGVRSAASSAFEWDDPLYVARRAASAGDVIAGELMLAYHRLHSLAAFGKPLSSHPDDTLADAPLLISDFVQAANAFAFAARKSCEARERCP